MKIDLNALATSEDGRPPGGGAALSLSSAPGNFGVLLFLGSKIRDGSPKEEPSVQIANVLALSGDAETKRLELQANLWGLVFRADNG